MKTIITVALLATIIGAFIAESVNLRYAAVELNSSVKTFEALNKRYVDILDKDIYLVNKDDLDQFNITNINKLRNEYKITIEKEISEEVAALEEQLKNEDFSLQNLNVEEINENIKNKINDKEFEISLSY